jgi:hypothetical protein
MDQISEAYCSGHAKNGQYRNNKKIEVHRIFVSNDLPQQMRNEALVDGHWIIGSQSLLTI